MARKHVAKHLAKLKKKHDQVRAKLFKLLQKVARHKGSWKPMYKKAGKGGFSSLTVAQVKRQGAASRTEFLKKNNVKIKAAYQKAIAIKKAKTAKGMSLGSAAGLSLPGASGFHRRRGRSGKIKKRHLKKRKLPKWVTRKTVPKKFPKMHKDMTKAAKGFGAHAAKLGNALGNLYNKHKDTINKIGSAVGGAILQVGSQYVSGKIQQAQMLAQQKLQQANQKFDAHLQNAQMKAQMAMLSAQNAGQSAYGQAQGAYGQAQGMAQQGYGAAMGASAQGMANQAGTAAYDAAGNLLGYF